MITPYPIAQKIIKVGNSLAVTLPIAFTKQHQLKSGASVFSKAVNGEIRYSFHQPAATMYQELDDQEFVKLAKYVEIRYKKVLQKLADHP